MSKYSSFYDTVDQIVTYGVDKDILHLFTSNEPFEGSIIIIKNRPVINFGSCSYLGLEFDPRVIKAAQDAVQQYGTQFSQSRAYVSLGLYSELQHLLESIFNAPCVISPTTTLAHVACIPVVISDDDAVIMDQQVHNSVQTAVQIVKARGVHIELVRHNRIDLLEERISELRSKHKKIWYMADGIYSMFGDCTPVKEIVALMDKYPELYFYVDDAHGMSIHGKHGRGFVLSSADVHPKMIIASSLNKAFASGGGVLVFGDKETARKVGTVGGPFLSSGPMQPSALGAAIAVSKIHLDDEIILMQEHLKKNIRFTTEMLHKYRLPLISEPGAAIFFVAVSLPKMGHNLVRRMLERGFYVNLGVFPTVPMKKTGIRFTITRMHSINQIENMVRTLAEEFPPAMADENITLAEIYKAFKIPLPIEYHFSHEINSTQTTSSLKLKHFESIDEIDELVWNNMFRSKGSFDWSGMKVLENSFCQNEKEDDNWHFDYLVVSNVNDKIIAATFLTTAIWKDDMLSHGNISAQIEELRETDPYYLTSKVLCAGSLITEGEHLYIEKSDAQWREALQLLLKKIYVLQEIRKASQVVLRDFYDMDREKDDLLVDNGFFRLAMPDRHVIPAITWKDAQGFYNSLSTNSKNQLRKKVLRYEKDFAAQVVADNVKLEEIEHWYQLYRNVKSRNLEVNTFPLPIKFFIEIAASPDWEVIELTLPAYSDKPCCMVCCCKSGSSYIPMVIGIDYEHNAEFNIYRQALYQVVMRATALNMKQVLLGFTASEEKRKLGAVAIPTHAYVHTNDTYNVEAIEAISKTAENKNKYILRKEAENL